jgi:predicted PurR-regulated permease PerM
MKRPEPALLRLLVFAGSLLLALLVLILFRDIFLPLLLGLGIAYLFDPLVSSLERHGRSRTAGTLLVALLLTLLGVLLVLIVLPTIHDQLQRAAERLPEYARRLREQLEPWLVGLQDRYPEQTEQLREGVLNAARSNLAAIARAAGSVFEMTFSSLLGMTLFVLNLVFVPVFAFYLLVDLPHLKTAVSDLIPVPYRATVLARLREVDTAIASFLRGQLTIALVLAAINSIGLTLLGVPMGLVIGILAGLANLVPFMALVVGLAPALLLSWAEHGSLARVAGVLAVFSGAQMLEGTVLSPRILSASVNLHPVWVLLAILVGGNLFGFFGMLLAVPAAAAVQIFARHWVLAYKRSHVYGAGTHPEDPETPAPAAEPQSARGPDRAAVSGSTSPPVAARTGGQAGEQTGRRRGKRRRKP